MPTKRKSSKKKVAKNKLSKKKTVRVVSYTPSKKKVKKSAKKKPQRRGASAAAAGVTIKFSCSPCLPDEHDKHVDKGSQMVLHATNTAVTIEFENESPFVSGAGAPGSPFSIAKGKKRNEVAKEKSKKYRYNLSCEDCSRPGSNPSMIID